MTASSSVAGDHADASEESPASTFADELAATSDSSTSWSSACAVLPFCLASAWVSEACSTASSQASRRYAELITEVQPEDAVMHTVAASCSQPFWSKPGVIFMRFLIAANSQPTEAHFTRSAAAARTGMPRSGREVKFFGLPRARAAVRPCSGRGCGRSPREENRSNCYTPPAASEFAAVRRQSPIRPVFQ